MQNRLSRSKRLIRKFSNRVLRLVDAWKNFGDIPRPEVRVSRQAKPRVLTDMGYRRLIRNDPSGIFRLSVRLWSTDGVDLLCRIGTRERLGWEELQAYVSKTSRQVLPARWHVSYILHAAILNFALERDAKSLKILTTLGGLTARHKGIGEFSNDTRAWTMLVNASQMASDKNLLAELSFVRWSSGPSAEWAAELDNIREITISSQGSFDEWLECLNRPIVQFGFEGWQLDDGDDSTQLFSRLTAPAVSASTIATDNQPLVSIVVPCFNPGPTLLRSIESISRQSWKNLEILIIDDASDQGEDLIQGAALLDSRVRVIRQRDNGGAYKARNRGLREAKGEYVTFLDADDLSHPRRIEYQIAPLLENQSLVATLSKSLRLTENGLATYFGESPTRTNLSSLLFRRSLVLETLGYYDVTRKAADSEFRERIVAVFGADSVLTMNGILSLVQLTSGSLSRGDFRVGSEWMSGPRVAYRTQFRGWHRKLADKNQTALPLLESPLERPFQAPDELTGKRMRSRLSLAVLNDWNDPELTINWYESLAPSAEPIGLLRSVNLLTSLPVRRNSGVSDQVWTAVEDKRATWLSWAQRIDIDCLIVENEESLVLLPSAEAIGLRVQKVIIRRDTQTSSVVHGYLHPEWIESQCQRAFGVSPLWAIGELPRNV